MAYDDQNRVLLTQWVDSRVVNIVSTLNDTTIGSCARQVGSEKKTFHCPAVIRRYQQDMGSIDRNDQMRMHGGGFSNKAHFKKWYKKVYLAVLDCMMLNSLIAWNMSVSELRRSGRRTLKRHEFFQYIAQSLLDYQEPSDRETTPSPEQVRKNQAHLFIGDSVHIPTQSLRGIRCMVCRLECHWKSKELGQEKMTTGVGTCKCCGIHAHTAQPRSSNRKIHKIKAFANLTCFQIAHTPEGMDLFRRVSTGKGSYQVNEKHPIYVQLRQAHGLPIQRSTKKRRTLSQSQNSILTDNSENATGNSTVSDMASARPLSTTVASAQSSDTDDTSTAAGQQSEV